jgi:hypothetical protein
MKSNMGLKSRIREAKRNLRLNVANACHQALLTAHYGVKISDSETEANAQQIARLAVQHADALIEILQGDYDEE